jgi:ribosomal protein S18 acetylase RimI-like enzyme
VQTERASQQASGVAVVASAHDTPAAAALLDAHAGDMRLRYPDAGWAGVGSRFDTFWVASFDGHPVGCVGLRELAPGRVEVKHLYVEPAARRRGVAGALMAAFEAEAARRGADIVLETGTRQPEAIALYEARGYRRRGPYPGSDVDDACSVYLERATPSI